MAPLTWRVLGMTSDAEGVTRALVLGGFVATCGHHHDAEPVERLVAAHRCAARAA